MSIAPQSPQVSAGLEISHAYVRKPGGNLAESALAGVGIPDADRALYQHEAFCRALGQCGVEVRATRHDPAFPGGCFIGDMAVMAGNLAVICNFADKSPRQGEQQMAASLLAGSRILKFITAPGTLDAADVARVGDQFFIGLSERTNHEGAAQLAFFLTEFGFAATVLDIAQDTPLRLSAVVCDAGPAADGRRRVLLREDLARHYAFLTFDKIVVPWDMRGAINARLVNGTLLMPQGFAAVAEALRQRGQPVIELQLSEFEKMSGGIASLALCLPARSADTVVRLQDVRDRRVA